MLPHELVDLGGTQVDPVVNATLASAFIVEGRLRAMTPDKQLAIELSALGTDPIVADRYKDLDFDCHVSKCSKGLVVKALRREKHVNLFA